MRRLFFGSTKVTKATKTNPVKRDGGSQAKARVRAIS